MDTARPDEVRVKLDLAQARSAIRLYQQTHDNASPPTLTTLGLTLYFPADLAYDPSTGTVKNRTYPAL